ncbi:MmgE/PrpD family protein [Nocardioides sp. cx-173]|uniref:MmgE/PrpD family protein n=1 Tax=Nocardioides sp. cx-173 TaxID=2898796 RepID=UPI001E3AEB7C|nr:MmgE/PrpD family protein [Nocardioides sp. cx-173]MCD4524371.1 MmgE/PrpD family protein [Nocardioides sp. cx-173]UGB43141.1 MmgE/PrpD family protein [Nocardioides sp. cx-173]
MSIAPDLARWVVGPLDVPAAVEHAALRHLLDGVANAVAAARAGAADPAVTVATGLGGPAEATILGSTTRVSAVAAGLANGTLVHALDFDDTHAGGLVHATAVVLPAAFAVGEQVGASGREILDASVVGYEVACRVAAAAPHGFHAGGLHATMVAGVFSSAAVAARLTGLDAVTTAHALGIAGSQAGGLLAFLATGASTKQLHPGFASQSGILAARLAAAGATGPETVFDGPHGVYDALATGPVDTGVILRDLGSSWETTRIGIKPWPTCQLAHVTMAAAQRALADAGVAAAEIVGLHAQVHPDSASVVCAGDRDLTRPASPYAAKFSLPWSVAAILVDGRVGVDTYDAAALSRPELSALAARVTWDVTDRSGVVAADAPGDVVLTLADGRTVTGHLDRSPGGGSAPLSDESLLSKVVGNVGPTGPDLAAAVRRLPGAPDLTEILALAAAAAEPTRASQEVPA